MDNIYRWTGPLQLKSKCHQLVQQSLTSCGFRNGLTDCCFLNQFWNSFHHDGSTFAAADLPCQFSSVRRPANILLLFWQTVNHKCEENIKVICDSCSDHQDK